MLEAAKKVDGCIKKFLVMVFDESMNKTMQKNNCFMVWI